MGKTIHDLFHESLTNAFPNSPEKIQRFFQLADQDFTIYEVAKTLIELNAYPQDLPITKKNRPSIPRSLSNKPYSEVKDLPATHLNPPRSSSKTSPLLAVFLEE